jgi:DNA-binding CsgD family transcriptional regulator
MSNQQLPHWVETFTDSELEVLRLMTEGKSNREIADARTNTVETIRWYTKQIYSKLGVNSRAQAVLRAMQLRLFDDDPTEPSIATLAVHHNLPDYPLAFFGREAELKDICAMLRDPHTRLITIAGPGGIGKTRLAIEAAQLERENFADGVFFVSLTTATTANDIYPAIVRSMNLRVDDKHDERLMTFLKEKKVLLILDNFEHLTEAVHRINDLLNATGYVTIVVTSRVSLNLSGEYSRHLKGIDLPKHNESLMETTSAVQLFVDRAQRVRSDFSLKDNLAAVIEICRLVDGMPLAIEMATAWLKSLTCADIVREIHNSPDFLSHRDRDVEERHASMRVIFDYTWNRLNPAEQRVLRRLSMFRGGFGLAATQQIAGVTPGVLADLIDKSLLYQTTDGLYHFHDLLRQYVEHRLEAQDVGAVSTRSMMISLWASLVKGDFAKIRKIGESALEHNSVDKSLYEEAFGMTLLGVLSGVEGDYEQCKQLCEASRRILQHEGTITDAIPTVFNHLGLAIAACGTEDYHAVKQHILAALKIGHQLQIPAFSTLCLPVVAIVCAHNAEVENAIKYMALAFNHEASSPDWLAQWSLLTELHADLKAEIGEDVFEEVWKRGSNLNLNEVVKTILEGFDGKLAA